MISYGGLASSGSRILHQGWHNRPTVIPTLKNATVAPGGRGYSDRSNCYKAMSKHCVRYDTQSSFYRVTKVDDRWFFVQR